MHTLKLKLPVRYYDAQFQVHIWLNCILKVKQKLFSTSFTKDKWETEFGRDFWRSLAQPPADSRATFQATSGFSGSWLIKFWSVQQMELGNPFL